jgi:hypothetical protein
MKSLVCWLTIAMTALASIVPTPVRAQSAVGSLGVGRIPLGGFYSTTIYTPSPDNVTTNVTTQIGVGYYPFPNATGNYYRNPVGYPSTLPQYPIVNNPQPIVIYQQPSTYPRAILTRCLLKTLNDPQQSLMAVDRYTGKRCD